MNKEERDAIMDAAKRLGGLIIATKAWIGLDEQALAEGIEQDLIELAKE